jgi:hypothetical protein
VGAFFGFNPGGDLRSHTVTRAVSSALRGLTAVFGMGTGVSPAVRPPESRCQPKEAGAIANLLVVRRRRAGKVLWSSRTAISTGQLHALLRFHIPPIKVVVFDRPSEAAAAALGDLILGRASCLDAFSNYLFRTSLPSDAPGGTARSQEVRPSRSSRTRDSSPQVSCAHTR